MNKKTAGLSLAVIILIITAFTSPPAQWGLTEMGYNTLGILAAGLILWILEVMPLGVTALLVMILQPVYGVAGLGEAFDNFASSVVFFVLASFAISLAIVKTYLAQRLIKRLLLFAGNDTNKVIISFMVGTAVLSAFMSNVPVTALFMGLALGILAKIEVDNQRLKFGKVIMISIPFAGMIGGMMTPAGSSINVLTLEYITGAGYQVSFLEWMVYGVPITLLVLPFCWYVLIKLFKPENLDQSVINSFLDSDEIPQKMDKQEKKVLFIVGTVIVLWILGSWFPILDLTIVALAGMICFFLPGINALEWDEFATEASWNAVIMIGGVISIGEAAQKNELADWFLNLFVDSLVALPLFLLLIVLGIFLVVIKLPIPIGPAIVAISAPPLIGLAELMGIPVVVLLVPLAFLSGACLLVPLDAVPLITFSQRYYGMGDMFVSGAITSLVWVLIAAVWVPLAARILGVL